MLVKVQRTNAVITSTLYLANSLRYLFFQCTVNTIVNEHILFDKHFSYFYILQLTNIADLFDKITYLFHT